MKLRWLRPFIVLTAAAIVSISSIVMKRPVLLSLIWLLIVIIIFFIIGSIVTRIIVRTMNDESHENSEAENISLEDTEQESKDEES